MISKKFTILLILTFFTLLVKAQSEQEVLPAEKKNMTIITEPYTLYKGFFRTGMSFNYSALYKFFNDDGDKVPVSNASGRSWAAQLLLQYGINDRLQVTTGIPYMRQDLFLSYLGEAPGLGLFQQQKLEGNGSGLSDIWLGLDYQIMEATTTKPAIKLMFTGTFPTGAKNPVEMDDPDIMDIAVGAGHFSLEGGFAMRKINYPYSWTTYVTYKVNLEGEKQFYVDGPLTPFRDGNMLTVSGSFNFHMNEWLAITNDIYYFNIATDYEDGQAMDNTASWLVEYAPRLSFQIKRLRVNQSIQIPLIGKMAGADPGFILIVQYVL
ncbi:MAG: transporter [Bacteroidota bacterium]